jgi:hypothetical protein
VNRGEETYRIGLFSRKKSTARPATQGSFQPIDGEQLFVGENAYQGALKALLASRGHAGDLSALSHAIRETFTARLVSETNNQYDANAVRVDIDGHTVAYMSRGNAALFRKVHGVVVAEMVVEVYVPRNRGDGKGIVSVWPITD